MNPHTWSCDGRPHALQLKQDACQHSFESFVKKRFGDQPAALAVFQKFWVRAMLLVDDWKEMYQLKEQQLERLTEEHAQLRHEHQVLNTNLQGLKTTVQNMLGDVSALLQHTTTSDFAEKPCAFSQQPQLLPSQKDQKQKEEHLASDLQHSLAGIGPSIDSTTCHNTEPTSTTAASYMQSQRSQNYAAPGQNASRDSAQIVSSLICSIEQLSKQFADCQAGKAMPETDHLGSGCKSRCSTGGESSVAQQQALVTKQEGCASFARPSTFSTTSLGLSATDNTAAGSKSSGASQGCASHTALGHHVPGAPAGAPAFCAHVGINATIVAGQAAGPPISAASHQLSRPSSNPVLSQAANVALPASFVGAQPSWSHPPNPSLAPSPATATRHTLAWFLQNAGSPCTVNSSMPTTCVMTPAEPNGAAIIACETLSLAGNHHGHPAHAAPAGSDVTAATVEAHIAEAAVTTRPADAEINMEPFDGDLPGGNMPANAPGLSKPGYAVAAEQTADTTPTAAEEDRQQALFLEPSVSEWAGAHHQPCNAAQVRSGGGRAGHSSTYGRISSRAITADAAARGFPSCTLAPASMTAVLAPAAACSRSVGRTSGRTSSSSSSASLSELVRRQQQHNPNIVSIYQYEVHAGAAPASSTTSSMVAAAAAKLGIKVEQQRQMMGQKRGPGTSKVNSACSTGQGGRSRAASGNPVAAAGTAEGPLTAALNRQGSLSHTVAAAPSSRQAVPAGPAAPGRPSTCLRNNLTHSLQPRSASAGVQHHKVRPGSTAAVPVAAKSSSRLVSKTLSRPSNSSGHRAQKQQPAAGGTKSKRSQQIPKQHLQPGQLAAGCMFQAIASSEPTQSAAMLSITHIADSSLDASRQQYPDRPSSSGSSSSEVSDMVLLGSCASTSGWSNQTSPAHDTESLRRQPSSADAAVAEVAAAGISKLLLSQQNSARDVVSQSASKVVDLGNCKDMGARDSAARCLEVLHTNNQEPSGVGVRPADINTQLHYLAGAPTTAEAAISATNDSMTSGAAGAAPRGNAAVVIIADGSEPAAGLPVSVQRQTTALQQTAASTAAMVAVSGRMAEPLIAPAAGDGGLVELPDAVKVSKLADSPRKQPRKSLSTAAWAADRGAGDGKRALQHAGIGTGQAAVAEAQRVHGDCNSSNRAMPSNPMCASESAGSDNHQPSSPVSPLPPVSKRLRSSSDRQLLQQQHQETNQQQQVKYIQSREQPGTAAAADRGIDRLQVLPSEAAAATVLAAVPKEHSLMQCPEVVRNTNCNVDLQDRTTAVRATCLGSDASTTTTSTHASAVAASESGISSSAAWQDEIPQAADAGCHRSVTDLTLCIDQPAVASHSISSSTAAVANLSLLEAVHEDRDRPVTQLGSYPVAVSVEEYPTTNRDSLAQLCIAVDCQSVRVDGSKLTEAAGPHQAPEAQLAECGAEAEHADAVTPATAVRCDAWQQQPTESGSKQATDKDPAGCITNQSRIQSMIKHTDTLSLSNARPPTDAADRCATDAGGKGLFSLEELLHIVLDVMHSKKEVDQGCLERQEPLLTPTQHLQQYIKRQVRDDEVLYGEALAKTLASLDWYQEHQPEVAVFCRVLAGEVDEDYFHQHLLLRNHLQLLASHALMQQQQQWPDLCSQSAACCSFANRRFLQQAGAAQEEQQCHQEHWASRYDTCCHEVLSDAQLSWLLGAWGRQRSGVLVRPGGAPGGPQEEELHKVWWMVVNRHCSHGNATRMTACVVEALLLWELHQQLSCLTSVVEAFKLADVADRGLLDLQQFQLFCRELNDTMTESEVETLFVDELDKHSAQLVTFSTICRCLLPAM